MRLLLPLLILGLSGCNTPTPQFSGVTPVEIVVEGSTYRVFRSEDRAQAIRINSEWRPNKNAEAKITTAIEAATGCKVVGEMRGDAVLANARVDCGNGARPWPVEKIIEIECEIYGSTSDRLYCTTY